MLLRGIADRVSPRKSEILRQSYATSDFETYSRVSGSSGNRNGLCVGLLERITRPRRDGFVCKIGGTPKFTLFSNTHHLRRNFNRVIVNLRSDFNLDSLGYTFQISTIFAAVKSQEIFGLVLSGGRSTRMGIDKSTIDYHGQPQLNYMVAKLAKFCSSVYVSTRKEQQIAKGMLALPDRYEIQGPINGILTALEFRPGHAWLIVAVDMPNVSESVLQVLIDNRDPDKLATCFYNSKENFPEPLLAIWEPNAMPPLKEFVKNGNKSPKAFIQHHNVKCVTPDDPSILLNINSPAEYEKFRTEISRD